MKKEIKIKIINAALLCSILGGGFALDYHYSHMPLTGVIKDADGTIIKETINYRDGSYEERIPASTYINANGEVEYYAPAGYALTMNENGEYICVRTYKEDTQTR